MNLFLLTISLYPEESAIWPGNGNIIDETRIYKKDFTGDGDKDTITIEYSNNVYHDCFEEIRITIDDAKGKRLYRNVLSGNNNCAHVTLEELLKGTTQIIIEDFSTGLHFSTYLVISYINGEAKNIFPEEDLYAHFSYFDFEKDGNQEIIVDHCAPVVPSVYVYSSKSGRYELDQAGPSLKKYAPKLIEMIQAKKNTTFCSNTPLVSLYLILDDYKSALWYCRECCEQYRKADIDHKELFDKDDDKRKMKKDEIDFIAMRKKELLEAAPLDLYIEYEKRKMDKNKEKDKFGHFWWSLPMRNLYGFNNSCEDCKLLIGEKEYKRNNEK